MKMHDCIEFHHAVEQLLNHIDIDIEVAPEDFQDVVSLEINDAHTIHFGCIDPQRFFMLATLGSIEHYDRNELVELLKFSHLSDAYSQAVMSLNDEDEVCCFYTLPAASNIHILIEAFEVLLGAIEVYGKG